MTLAGSLAGLTVEVGFGVDAVGGDYFVLDDAVKGVLDSATYTLAPDTVFVDVTDHVAAVSTKRGRARETDDYSVGSAVVVFNDNDRRFDPAYSASPYAGQITPMRRIRVTWQNDELFAGWVDDWSVTYEPGDALSRVTAECVDGFAILANQELPEITEAHSGDKSGQRISRVLNRAEVNFPATRSIDTGNSTLGATSLGGNALTYLQNCARAEAGYLFVAADGTLTFRNRLSVLNATGAVVFSDDRTAGIPYRDVSLRSSTDLLYTRVTGASETTGTDLESVDAAAGDEFLVRTLPLGSLFNLTDTETQDLLDFHLERYSAPEVRFDTATINVGALTSAQVTQIVGLDLTDVVTVERSPLGVGDAISLTCLIDGIEHSITNRSWTVSLSFSNADARAFLMLDDPLFGALDSARLAF